MEPEVENIEDSRIRFVDGIRGWASIIVVLSHLVGAFLALSNPWLRQILNSGVSEFLKSTGDACDLCGGHIYNLPLYFFVRFVTDGDLAVRVFFVTSGFILSIKQIRSGLGSLQIAATARYFRLMIPILFTSLFAYTLLRVGLLYNVEVATSPERSAEWLGTFYKFEPSLMNAIVFSLYAAFFNYDGASSYNEVLWMMPIELLGSYAIFGYLGIFRRSQRIQYRVAFAIIIALFVISPNFGCFFFGYLVAEVCALDLNAFKLLPATLTEVASLAAFSVLCIISTQIRNNELGTCLVGCLMVASIIASTTLVRVLSSPVSRFLGKISYPMYLVQLPIICSWSSFAFLELEAAKIDSNFTIAIVTVSTLAICIAIGTLLVPLDLHSIRFSRNVARQIVIAGGNAVGAGVGHRRAILP
jgi:peptidoglycan/LPS O-acetylase OafA/YrhL